jgi:hypothetical protein
MIFVRFCVGLKVKALNLIDLIDTEVNLRRDLLDNPSGVTANRAFVTMAWTAILEKFWHLFWLPKKMS